MHELLPATEKQLEKIAAATKRRKRPLHGKQNIGLRAGAPDEPHLYILRSYVFTVLGQDSPARVDLETAARLGGNTG